MIKYRDNLCIEPDLDSKIDPQHFSTWGMKKQLCITEADIMRSHGCTLNDNPYAYGGWSYIWWTDAFAAAETRKSGDGRVRPRNGEKMDIVEELRLNHEFCPKEVILAAADEIERMRAVAKELAAAASLVLMRAKEQPGPFKWLIDAGSLQQALTEYNALPNKTS